MDATDLPEDMPVNGPEETEGRATNRESLFLGVEIQRSGSAPSGRIRNISATGALVECDTQFFMGEHIVLTFRGITNMGATVVRQTSKGVGVRFDAKIDPAVCKQAVTNPQSKALTWTPPPPDPSRYRHPGLRTLPRR